MEKRNRESRFHSLLALFSGKTFESQSSAYCLTDLQTVITEVHMGG